MNEWLNFSLILLSRWLVIWLAKPKGIKRIKHDEKNRIGKITYDEKLLTEKKVMEKVRKICYEVKI